LKILTALIASVLISASGLTQDLVAPFELDCDAAARFSDRYRGEAVVVVYQGHVVCEHYRNSAPEDAWELASGVKSFTAAMAAAAVEDGLLTLDEPVAQTLTEWQDDERLSRITIRELLSLVSGIHVVQDRYVSYAEAVNSRARNEPGTRFAYGPRPFAVFGEVLRRKLNAAGSDMSPADYFRSRVLIPLDADVSAWSHFEGDPLLSEGVEISPMHWARFGYLVSQGGAIGETRLLDEDATNAMFEARFMRMYGMGWWIHHEGFEPRSRFRSARAGISAAPANFPTVFAAAGSGDQRLYILPDYDLVVVRMTRGVRVDRDLQGDVGFSGQLFLRALLPGIPSSTES
jgi:CubicO group peptidase (beta-lactamase class C family)